MITSNNPCPHHLKSMLRSLSLKKKLKIKNPFYGLLTSANFEKWHATCNNAGFVWINIPFY
jgi:hypothetical protein